MIKISKADVDDLAEIKALLRETWGETYKNVFTTEEIEKITSEWHSLDLLRKQIKNPKILFLVIKENGNLIAMCNTDKVGDDHVNIQRLHVKPGYQGRGLGSKLIKKIIKSFPNVKKLELEVEKSNKIAIAFYQKQGFEKIGDKTFEVQYVKIPCFVMEKLI